MTNTSSPTAADIATAAAVGLIAGLAASFVMNRFQALTQPAASGDGEPATERAADDVARAVTGAPIPDADKPAAGQLVHYGAGAVLGIGYAVAAEFAPKVTLGAGTAFATLTWAMLDEVAVPAAGLSGPPWKSPIETHAYGLASHLVFGIATETTRRLALRAHRRLADAIDAAPRTPPTRTGSAARP
ncbi:DUF1440 domain-containing protein [Sphingomonas ginsenosidivorax]|uniref:DUF1440 domain-containing protein n=1 Tax=Sphingomonas ginsenosidivorax TaxID=862135 RepID=A0A5C6UIY5_9SPHN|nr:DUF1440 domain-containing protein [Sphingomonas ginsenosidivorax]TXC72181.1 DUF1440 domain-containing protein [Sphingomonas ginsenosidivorax]